MAKKIALFYPSAHELTHGLLQTIHWRRGRKAVAAIATDTNRVSATPQRVGCIGGLVVILLGLFQSPALAGPSSWQMREVRRPQGSLDYCIADQTLADGRHLNIALDPEGRMNLGLVLPDQAFTPQETLPLKLGFDKKTVFAVQARALTATMLLIDSDAPERWRAALGKARLLTVSGLGKPLRFPLDGFAARLKELDDCAAQQDRALPPQILAVLQRAGLADGLTLIAPPPGLSFVDVAWQRGTLNGGTQAFEPKPDFRTAARGLRAVLKTYCQGLWTEEMEMILVRGKAQLQRGVMSCNAVGSEEVMAVVFFAPGDGTARYYTHAGSGDDRAAIIAANNALAKALLTAE